MENNRHVISFVAIPSDHMIIPQFAVSMANFEFITSTFMSDWKLFISNLQKDFNNLDIPDKINVMIQNLKKDGYKVRIDSNFMCATPPNFIGGFIHNYPDLFDSSWQQIKKFISQTKQKLSDICIKTSQNQYLVNIKLNPHTYLNLNVENSEWMADYATLYEPDSKVGRKIWISILVWWKYRKEDNSSCNKFLNYLETHCSSDIFHCNNYIMLYSRAIILKEPNLLTWFKENISNIIWDEDLLSETPSYHLNICKREISNELFTRELERVGIK